MAAAPRDLFRADRLMVRVKQTLEVAGQAQDKCSHENVAEQRKRKPVAISVQLIQRIRFHNVFVNFHPPTRKALLSFQRIYWQ